mmetsp:Transcript_7096/g.16996  ORF Transcript_7096/g.16996 Transcript_7096/m.16996 type:complete len:281 (-) Transcript_7096:228-1070(-)
MGTQHSWPGLQTCEAQDGSRFQCGCLRLQVPLAIEDLQVALCISHDDVALKLQHVRDCLCGWQELCDLQRGQVQHRQAILTSDEKEASKHMELADGTRQALFERVGAIELLGRWVHLPQPYFSVVTSRHEHTLMYSQSCDPLGVALEDRFCAILGESLYLPIPKATKEPATAEEQRCGRLLELHLQLSLEFVFARGAHLWLPAFHRLVLADSVDPLLAHGHGLYRGSVRTGDLAMPADGIGIHPHNCGLSSGPPLLAMLALALALAFAPGATAARLQGRI